MSAAQYGFPYVSSDQSQWLALAEAVWNSQQRQWDTESCGGGLYQQISNISFSATAGPKNSPSAVGFMNLGARLYAYTGNETYADWTAKAWDWLEQVGLVADNGAGGLEVYVGIVDPPRSASDCSQYISTTLWSDSPGKILNAAAMIFNMTGDTAWEDCLYGIWKGSEVSATDSFSPVGFQHLQEARN
jgi:mannan endo-1,6-alpha-mannosidase